jgi:nucleoside-diphosphate-sugar epimerase
VLLGDLLDEASLARAVAGCSAVIHLAAVVAPSLQSDTAAVEQVNHLAAVELARRAREAGCERFVFISSIAAMGFFSGLATAESPCHPASAYGRAKRDAEVGILSLQRRGFFPVVLRPPTVYGPGERYNFLSLTRAVRSGLFRVIGPGDNIMPLCTTENVARAAIAAALGRVPFGVHLVADDAHYSMNRVHAALSAALGVRRPWLRLPTLLAHGAGAVNELAHRFGAPLALSRSRVRTLTVDQPFDVSSLRTAGVALDAPLEQAVAATVAEYRSAGVLK